MGKKIPFAHSVLLRTFHRGSWTTDQIFRLSGRLQQTTLHNSQVEAPTPKCLTKMRQDCDLPKHGIFMAICLNLVNFRNGGKLFRAFPVNNSLYACFSNVSVSEKILRSITFIASPLKSRTFVTCRCRCLSRCTAVTLGHLRFVDRSGGKNAASARLAISFG